MDFETKSRSTKCLFQLHAYNSRGEDLVGGAIVAIKCSFDVKSLLLSLKENLSRFGGDADFRPHTKIRFEPTFSRSPISLQQRFYSEEASTENRYTTDNTTGASPVADQIESSGEVRNVEEESHGLIHSAVLCSSGDSAPLDCSSMISAEDLCWLGLQGTADV